MEIAVLILLVIATVAGILIYQNLPDTRIRKADSLAANGQWDAAIATYERFFQRPEIPARIAKALIEKAEKAQDPWPLYQQVQALRKRISGKVPESFDQQEAKAELELAQQQYKTAQKVANPEARLIALRKSIAYLSLLNQKAEWPAFAALLTRQNNGVTDTLYTLGKMSEQAGDYNKAITLYKDAGRGSKDDKKLAANLLLRIEICKTKDGGAMEQVDKRLLAQADAAIQNDYLYRLAISLIRTKKFSAAKTVVDQMKASGQKNLTQLDKVFEGERNKALLADVDIINLGIEKIHGDGLTTKGLEALYSKINTVRASGTGEDKELAKQLDALRPAFFNRLLAAYREEKTFDKAFALVASWPLFHQDPGLLKNLAQCAAGMVRAMQLTSDNSALVVSAFLTACHSDRVMLSSLEETSWDDAYTFTLRDALGSKHRAHKSLPENVNYNAPNEDNIPIGDTQRELIKQFETLLGERITSPTLLEQCLSAFHKELDIISTLTPLLKHEILLAGPAFAAKYELANNLRHSLEAIFAQTGNESALDAAIAYKYGPASNSLTDRYARVKASSLLVSKAVTSGEFRKVRDLLYPDFGEDLQLFKILKETTESDWIFAARQACQENEPGEAMASALEEMRKQIADAQALNHHYADAVASLCIKQVNEETIQLLPAMRMMEKAYRASPDSTRVCDNLITLIRMNLVGVLNGNHSNENDLFACLDGLNRNKSSSFKNASYELAETRDELAMQLVSGKPEMILFLTDPSIPPNTTAAGIKLKKVFKYFNNLSESPLNIGSLFG